MNSEATKLIIKRQEETKALGGPEAYRLHALQHLQLKTVVKESHATTVHALAFNHASPNCSNLFATVGADQATVYDDSHMADYIGVVVHFVNEKTQHASGGDLSICTWINSSGWSPHPHGDACLAVAGSDPTISIISVVEAAVVKLLQGHSKDVIDLSAAPAHPNLLVSLSKDGNIRLWNVPEETCISSCTVNDAVSVALSPDASSIMVGTSRGRIMRYTITTTTTTVDEGSREEFKTQGGIGHTDPIDCLRFLPNNRIATKSSDGRMFVWSLASGEQLAAWKVPGSNQFSIRCRFSTTADGKYVSVGNGTGDCYVYDSETGKREAHVSAIRVSAPVRACALSEDCRHLVAAVGKGFVFRFEYLAGGKNKDGEDSGSGSGEEENKNDNVGEGVEDDDVAEAMHA